MNSATPGGREGARSALLCALPAMALAAVLLLPFLNSPFTIDDPVFLREAQHAAIDPLHPGAFDFVWAFDVKRRFSEIVVGGLAASYFLLPTALTGSREWVGHLCQIAYLCAALWSVALVALRLGLSRSEARWTALLVGSGPAVLGMAATVMPDIPAMLCVTVGVERVLAWRERRRWHAAALAVLCLSVAALTRLHTILVLAPAFILLLDGIGPGEIRASFRSFPLRFLPLAATPIVVFAASTLMADPDSVSEDFFSSVFDLKRGLMLPAHNAAALLVHWLFAVPLTIPWLVARFRMIPPAWLWIPALVASVASIRLGWPAFAAAAALVVMADIVWDAIRRRDRVQLALWLWLWLAIPVIIYVQLPPKYLLPCAPAAAMLIVRLVRRGSEARARWLVPALTAYGAILGVLIVLGVRDLGEIQRRAVTELIVPHVQKGERVWFAGDWGFHWYAERAGAEPATVEPPMPLPGDIIVISQISFPPFGHSKFAHEVLQTVVYPGNGISRVMDMRTGVGFFSNPYGYLPWGWGSGDANRFEIWRAE